MFNPGKERQLPTLLLIDDDMISREVMATVLTMSGYTVHTAIDGAESIELLTTGKSAPDPLLPDMILMDAQMPGLSGVQLIGELRACSKAPIVTISASNPPADLTDASDGFLLKPFGAGDLRKLLEKHQVLANPAVQSGPEEPVVNAETLAQLRNLMPEPAVREIYAAIIADLVRRHTAIEAAIVDGNKGEIHRIGHAIKGGCSMVGALQAARLGASIESGILDNGIDGRGDNKDNSVQLLRDLRIATRNLERMLEAEFPV